MTITQFSSLKIHLMYVKWHIDMQYAKMIIIIVSSGLQSEETFQTEIAIIRFTVV